VTARAGNENGFRKVTAVLTEQQYTWAQEVVLSGAMEGLTCSVSTVIRLALDELRQRHSSPKKLEAALRAHIWRERVPETDRLPLSRPQAVAAARTRPVTPRRPENRAEPAAGTRVVLVVEQPMLRAGLRSVLAEAADLSVSEDVGGAAAALARIQADPPDVALLDLPIPDSELAAAIRTIAAGQPRVKVVVLAAGLERDRILAAVEAGAAGCLLREASPQELLNGIRAVARGESPLSLGAALALLGSRPEKPPLTPRERQILALVARGLANKQIAGRLGISEKTVKTHLGSAFQRLGVSDRTQAALWAERNGLLKEPTPSPS
jgi:DNA-binding NarL/FixJ family response regulator/Arc/MetJ-type ribon-helix-helix transcriptional regulator